MSGPNWDLDAYAHRRTLLRRAVRWRDAVTIDIGWLLFWLFAFTALGLAIGWQIKGNFVERRECRRCDAPTVTPHADYCRRHSAELIAQLRAGEGRDG